MPDLGGTTTLLNSETLTMTRFPNSLPSLSTDFSNSSDSLFNRPVKTLISDNFPIDTGVSIAKPGLLNIRFTASGKVSSNSSIDGIRDSNKVLEDYVSDWKVRRINSGVSENRCFLPFLVGAPSLVECRICSSYIYPGDEVSCSVRGCQQMYHGKCIKETLQFSAIKKFKCPQHSCFLCKQKFFWRCVRCEVASHDKCAAWPDEVVHLREQSGWAVCWRHPEDWRHEQD